MIPAAGVPSEINTSSSSSPPPVVDATKEGNNVTISAINGDGKSSVSNSSSSNVLLVKPPPDIRAVVDRTALFVSKNGRTFEQRILNSAKGKTPKFAFLYESSPFHAYYESRITFYLHESQRQNDEEEGAKEEGGGEVTTATSPTVQEAKVGELTSEVPKERNATEGGGTVLTLKKSKSSTIIDPISRELLRIRQRLYGTSTTEDDATTPQQQHPEPPPPFQLLHIVAPSTITSVQIELIKLCAQFTAMARLIPNESTVGNTFLNTLRHREWNNSSTFGFLQPRHAHFAYYTALVDAYYQILLKGMTTPQDDTTHIIQPISIQDSLNEACYRAEYARYLQEQEVKRLAGDDHYAVVATVDWHDFVVVETIDFPQDEVVQVAAPPPPRKLPSLPAPVLVPEEDDEEEQEIRGDATTEHLHIVTDYTPRVVPTATAKELSKTTLMIDPISGKPISVADLSEHMRIQLLDPKWALEKKRFQEKQRESNLLSQGDDIAKNIRRLYSSAATSETSAYNKKINDTEEITAKLNISKGQEETIISSDPLQWSLQEINTSSVDMEPKQSHVLAAVPPPGTEQSEIAKTLTGHKRAIQEDNDGGFPTFPSTEFALSNSSKRPRTEDDVIPTVDHVAPSTTLTSSIIGIPPGAELQPLLPLTLSTAPNLFGVPPLEENVATEGVEEAQQQLENFAPWVPLDIITLTVRSPDAQPVILVIEDAQKRTVKSIKESVHQKLGGSIPVSKMQFKVGRLGLFLKDAAFIGNVEGILESETIDLILKVRGGKR